MEPVGQAEDGGPAGGVVLADQAFDHQGDMPRRLACWSGKTSVGILVCGT